MRVLPEPQHAVAGPHAGVVERVRESVHSGVELGVRQPYVAVDRGEDGGPAARVLAQEVAERQVVEQIRCAQSCFGGRTLIASVNTLFTTGSPVLASRQSVSET